MAGQVRTLTWHGSGLSLHWSADASPRVAALDPELNKARKLLFLAVRTTYLRRDEPVATRAREMGCTSVRYSKIAATYDIAKLEAQHTRSAFRPLF